MKQILLSFGLFVTLLTNALPTYAWEPLENIIPLSLVEIKPNDGHPRTPVYVPQVAQEGHALYFHDAVDFTVNIYSVDEDENLTLEYTTFVPSTMVEVQLPSDLTGTYVIEVIRGEQHFEGVLVLGSNE